MDVIIKKCDRETLPELITLIDKEFIYSKGRSVSLATRYSSLFSDNNLENVYVAFSGETLLATTTVRKFVLLSDGQLWKGAMIGLVCTALEARGRGLGSLVMDAIVQENKKSDMDFMVLWTGINGFYERLGWITEDDGAFGKVNFGVFCCNDKLSDPLICSNVDFGWIEQMREEHLSQRVLRSKDDYTVIPPSVDVVEYFICKGTDANGYAIVGRKDRNGFIYEMVGSPDAFQVLLQSIGQHVDNLFVNDRPNSISGLWMNERQCVEWQPQNQTMWYGLSNGFAEVSCKGLYIPYFDRI